MPLSWLKDKKYSAKIAGKKIVEHVKFYRSQLGFLESIPSEGPGVAAQKFDVPSNIDITTWLKQFYKDGDFDEEDVTWSSVKEAMEKPYNFITRSLHVLLDEMEQAALMYPQG